MKRNKKPKETLGSLMKELADECKETGHVNLAIVLYAYLGSVKMGIDGPFAKHCQDFAKDGMKLIKEIKEAKTRRNN